MDPTMLNPAQQKPSPNMEVSPLFGIPTQELPKQSIVDTSGTTDLSRPEPKKHGAVHNILSTLGDFLLESTGLSDIIKHRQLNEAMQGFDQDPQGTISRVSGIDYGVGSKLRDQYIDNQRLAAAQESTAEARAARMQQAQFAVNDRTRGRAAAMLGTMAGWDDGKRQANYGAMRANVLKYGQANGVDLSGELPETYDSNALDSFIDASVPVGMQRSQRLTQEKNDATTALGEKRVAETGRHNIVSEGISQARVGETARHNGVTEGQGSQRIAASAARSSGGGRVKPLGRYVGDDGRYRVMMNDGSERVSTAKVRPTGAGKTSVQEGMRRVVNGAVYEIKGGKPVRVQ